MFGIAVHIVQIDGMHFNHNSAAVARLKALPPGRHYGASADSDCWVMVGRDLRDVTHWSIVPPAASLTFAWGEGGCAVEFGGGGFQMTRGDWMWIDAGFAHRGETCRVPIS